MKRVNELMIDKSLRPRCNEILVSRKVAWGDLDLRPPTCIIDSTITSALPALSDMTKC